MIRALDQVVLTCDLRDHGLKRGDVGMVVLVHQAGGYEVEFMTLDGQTLAVLSLSTQQVRPIGKGEIASARLVQSAS